MRCDAATCTSAPPRNRPGRARTGSWAQRGSVLVYAAIFMSLGVILLVGLELGFLYYV